MQDKSPLSSVSCCCLAIYFLSFYIYLICYTSSQTDYFKIIRLAQSNVKKNYIQNVRVINDGDDCQKNEITLNTVIQKGGNSYHLNEIYLEKSFNTKRLIKLCQEINLDSNFDYLSKHINQTNLPQYEECKYNGLIFNPQEESIKCPVSDIIFSLEEEEEEINGYEKIAKKEEQGVNIFIKRSDEKMTPLVAISMIRELSFLQKSLNMTFSMRGICKQEYGLYEAICSDEELIHELDYTIVKENQIALDIQCHNDLLTFNSEQPYVQKKYIFYFIIAFFIDMYALKFLDESKGTCIDPNLSIYFALNIYRQYLLYDENSDLLQAAGYSCYINGNPLEFIRSDLKVYLTIIIIYIAIPLSQISYVIFIILMRNINKYLPQRYQRFNNQEMVQV